MTGSFTALFWVRLIAHPPCLGLLLVHVPHLAPQFPLSLLSFFSEDGAFLEFLEFLEFEECLRMG